MEDLVRPDLSDSDSETVNSFIATSLTDMTSVSTLSGMCSV